MPPMQIIKLKKERQYMFNDKRERYLSALILFMLVATIQITGCASTYRRVAFCWTTNHRIPPDKRMISMNETPLFVKNELIKWVLLHDGEVVSETNDYDKIITLSPDSSTKYQIAHDMAEKRWNSYESNRMDGVGPR